MSKPTSGRPNKRRKGQRARGKRPLRLKPAVEHPVRLDILNCLDGKPRTISQASVRIGREEAHLSYHLGVLRSCGLVKESGDGKGANVYEVRLKDLPCWVTRAVNERLLG